MIFLFYRAKFTDPSLVPVKSSRRLLRVCSPHLSIGDYTYSEGEIKRRNKKKKAI